MENNITGVMKILFDQIKEPVGYHSSLIKPLNEYSFCQRSREIRNIGKCLKLYIKIYIFFGGGDDVDKQHWYQNTSRYVSKVLRITWRGTNVMTPLFYSKA